MARSGLEALVVVLGTAVATVLVCVLLAITTTSGAARAAVRGRWPAVPLI